MQEMLTSTALAVTLSLQLEDSVVKFPMLLTLTIPYVWILVSTIIILIQMQSSLSFYEINTT